MSEIQTQTLAHPNGTNVATLHASGYLLKNKVVAFSAYNGPRVVGGSMATIAYTAVMVNTDNCYSTSTYKFTAPVAGIYHFSFSHMAYNNEHSRCQFAKNGSLIHAQFYCSSASSNYSRMTGDIILALAVNDTIEVKRNVQNAGSEGIHSDYRHFSGMLLG